MDKLRKFRFRFSMADAQYESFVMMVEAHDLDEAYDLFRKNCLDQNIEVLKIIRVVII